MKRMIRIILLVVVAGVCVGCPGRAGPDGKNVLGNTKYFTASLEQGGKAVKIVNNEARLRREPFTVILSFSKLAGVMVNASTNTALMKVVKSGQAPETHLPLKRGLSEYFGNPNRQILVSDKGYNYWYYLGPTKSSFDKVSQSSDKRFYCRRLIANVRMEGSDALIPIDSLKAKALYLVIAKPTPAWKGRRRVSEHTEYLKLLFE